MRSSFYRNGRLWSREGIRLLAAVTTSGSSETSLATQSPPATATQVFVVSAEDADGKTTSRTISGTIAGSEGVPAIGNVLRLAIAAAHYDYTVTGSEENLPGDIYAAVVAIVAAANAGAGDPSFDVADGTTDIDLTAKTPGLAANDITVTLAWISGAATAALVNTPAVLPTGALTVRVDFLDADGHERHEILTLDGTDAVLTERDAIWVQRLTVVTAGSGNVADGEITASIDGDAFVSIKAGEVQSQSCGYMVPTAKQLRITGVAAGGPSAVRVRVRSTHDPETGVTFGDLRHLLADFFAGPQAECYEFEQGSAPLPAGTVIAVTATVNSALATATLTGYLEPADAVG